MRSLIIVRTHLPSEAAFITFDNYLRGSGLDVVFCCDERKEEVDTGGRRKIVMNSESIARLKLFEHHQCGWRCGDYFYYTAREAFPDYDHYWLAEPDVLLNMKDLYAFFESWDDDPADMLMIKLGERRENWAWYGTVADKVEQVYGCVYSFSRLTGSAIDRLLAERQRASEGMTAEQADLWPNDEAFTASIGTAIGLKGRDFNDGATTFYTNETFRNGAVFDRTVIDGRGPDDQIYHPVRPMRRWLEFSYRVFAEMREVTERREASALTRYGIVLLEQEDMKGAALVPLMQARRAWASASWEDYAHSSGEESNRLGKVTRLIRSNFGPGGGKPRIGMAYAAISNVGSNVVRKVDPADFPLEDGVPIASASREYLLPYAWDLEKRELLCTMHIRPADVLDKPFLYGAQRDQARVVVSLPLAKLNDLFGAPDPEAAFVFILSIGRTGSTLFQTLLQAMVPRAVSEPDTLTQLAADPSWRDDPGLARRLIWHSVSAFQHTYIEDAPAWPVAIKTRSQVNGMLPQLVRVFPKAQYVFLTRERTAWARSTYRSFGMAPDAVAGRLKQGIVALSRLKAAKPDATVMAYEDIVADPVAAVERIAGRPASDEEREKILGTMKKDSQQGTKVAREKTGETRGDEDKWLAEFEAAWARIRPAAMIEALGLDF